MSTSTRTYQNGTSPTVLLVHGAFEDTSMWAGVIPTLLVAGIDVRSVANPLRGLTVDAAYLADIAADIDGPVLFAGHAYGGAVLTVAGSSSGNVVGLVYVAAFAIDAGESALDIATRFPESRLNRALRPASFQTCAGEPAVELDISRDEFAEVFAADLADPVTRVLAACQRPIAATALEEKAQVAAWRTLPSWYLVASADRVIHPDAQRFMAQRAGAETVEIDASHAVALSHPAAVAELIRSAATVRPRRFP